MQDFCVWAIKERHVLEFGRRKKGNVDRPIKSEGQSNKA